MKQKASRNARDKAWKYFTRKRRKAQARTWYLVPGTRLIFEFEVGKSTSAVFQTSEFISLNVAPIMIGACVKSKAKVNTISVCRYTWHTGTGTVPFKGAK